MIFHNTDLKGAYVIELEPFKDQRGQFARTFCKKEFEEHGLVGEFVQFNHSQNVHKGTLRGMHFQHPPFSEVKLVRCVKGAVLDVIIDIRKDSSTYLLHTAVELSAFNQKMIYIPEGFAHGFQTLEAHTELLYFHSNFYQPGAEGGLKFDDPVLGIQWPLTPSYLSEKDKAYELLSSDFQGIKLIN